MFAPSLSHFLSKRDERDSTQREREEARLRYIRVEELSVSLFGSSSMLLSLTLSISFCLSLFVTENNREGEKGDTIDIWRD